MKKSLRLALALLAGLLPILACNMPVAAPEPPEGLSSDELRRTLVAPPPPQGTGQAPPPANAVTPTPLPLLGPQTATPGEAPPPADIFSLPDPPPTPQTFLYFTQPGDTLPAVALRFGVVPGQITSPEALPTQAFFPPGQALYIPNLIGDTPYPSAILPDQEIVNSPAAAGFDIPGYIQGRGGFLSTYREEVDKQWLTGAEIVSRVASEASVNPRLLLSLIEYRSGWVLGQPAGGPQLDFPLGLRIGGERGLYRELALAAQFLNTGYYGWRQGTLSELKFVDGSRVRLSPNLNAGSVAVQYLMAIIHSQEPWRGAVYGERSFPNFHAQMFGDPWARATAAGPLFPEGLAQPAIELPFPPGERWSLTGGPHSSWSTGTPRGALDFAAVTGEAVCVVSRAWTTAAAPGIVARSAYNVVAIDLDGDGYEQTGWVLVYLHVADHERVAAGTWVAQDDRIGHPSCERGRSTGTHVHIARKFNGEWIAAEGPLPFVLSGWQAFNGEKNYQGGLVKGDQTVSANSGGTHTSIIVR